MGPVCFGKKEEHIFLGREMAQNRDFSEQTAIEIDSEIKEIVKNAHDQATQLLTQHREALNDLAQALLERESLGGDEVDRIIGLERDATPEDEKPTPAEETAASEPEESQSENAAATKADEAAAATAKTPENPGPEDAPPDA
jgi:cell division protease FtsH